MDIERGANNGSFEKKVLVLGQPAGRVVQRPVIC